MASIPQLQADLGAMSLRLAKSEARVAELEAMPRRIIEVQVPVDRVVYRDREVIVEKRVEVPVEVIREVTRKVYDHAEIDRLGVALVNREAEISRLKAKLAVKPSTIVEYVEKRVEVPVEVIREVTKEVPVIELKRVVDYTSLNLALEQNKKLSKTIERLKVAANKPAVVIVKEVMVDTQELMGN